MNKKQLYADSSTVLNSLIVTDKSGKIIIEKVLDQQKRTIDEMEALAIVEILTFIQEPVKIRTDNKSVYKAIKQTQGYTTRFISDRTKLWCFWIRSKLEETGSTIKWIPRTKNIAGKYIDKKIKDLKKMNKFYKFPKGKKTKEWERAKNELAPSFFEFGIVGCEIGRYIYNNYPEYEDLMETHRHRFAIAWAHGDKRDNLIGYELYFLVAKSCVDCHNFIEYRPDMREIVKATIKARRMQPSVFIKYIKLHVAEGFETDLLDL